MFKDRAIFNNTRFAIYVTRRRRTKRDNLLSLPVCSGEGTHFFPSVEDGVEISASRTPGSVRPAGSSSVKPPSRSAIGSGLITYRLGSTVRPGGYPAVRRRKTTSDKPPGEFIYTPTIDRVDRRGTYWLTE